MTMACLSGKGHNKKVSAKGQIHPQELEEGTRSGPSLIVIVIYTEYLHLTSCTVSGANLTTLLISSWKQWEEEEKLGL